MRVRLNVLAQDSGIDFLIVWMDADALRCRLGYRLSGNFLPYSVSAAVIRTPEGHRLPLLRSLSGADLTMADIPAEGVLEFAPLPPSCRSATCLVTRLAEPTGSAADLTDVQPTLDPYNPEVQVELSDKVHSWLKLAKHELAGMECEGWWQLTLAAPEPDPATVRMLERRIPIANQVLRLNQTVQTPAGVLLSYDLYPASWEDLGEDWEELIHGLAAESNNWAEFDAKCSKLGIPPRPMLLRPRFALEQKGDRSLLPGRLSGPWGPLRYRSYVTFDNVKGDFDLLLEGLVGIPLPDVWSHSFKPGRYFEMSESPVSTDLISVAFAARLMIETVYSDSSSLFVVYHIQPDSEIVDRCWINRAALQDAYDNINEAEGETTAWIEAAGSYCTGLAFPPLVDELDKVTLFVTDIDLAFKQPIRCGTPAVVPVPQVAEDSKGTST